LFALPQNFWTAPLYNQFDCSIYTTKDNHKITLGSSFPPSFLPPILQSKLAPTQRRSGEEERHLEKRRWEGAAVALGKERRGRMGGWQPKAREGGGGCTRERGFGGGAARVRGD
jgi:hypothetical protein